MWITLRNNYGDGKESLLVRFIVSIKFRREVLKLQIRLNFYYYTFLYRDMSCSKVWLFVGAKPLFDDFH